MAARHYTELKGTSNMSERPTSSRHIGTQPFSDEELDRLVDEMPQTRARCHTQSTAVCADDDHISRGSKGCETAGRAQLEQTGIPTSLERKLDLYFSYSGTVLKSRRTCTYMLQGKCMPNE